MIDDFDLPEVESPENMQFLGKQENFSHEQLAMIAYRKCIEAFSKEMKEGHMSIATDNKGKQIPVYVEDTRQTAISCILTLKNVLINDINNSPQKDKIKEVLGKVQTLRDNLLNEEFKYWSSLNYSQRQDYSNKGYIITKGFFCTKFPFYNYFIDGCIEIYRELLETIELSLASSRYLSKMKVVNTAED